MRCIDCENKFCAEKVTNPYLIGCSSGISNEHPEVVAGHIISIITKNALALNISIEEYWTYINSIIKVKLKGVDANG